MSSSELARRPPTWLLVVAGGAALATAACIAWLDAPVARALAPWAPWPVWSELLWLFEVVGGLTLSRWTYAIALPVLALGFTLAPRGRRWARGVWLLALVHVVAKLATNEIKDATGRLRPGEWLARGGDMFFVDGGISFPSGHVTYFLSLTLPIAVFAPRLGRRLLFVPFAVALCRVAVNAHFLSDVLGAVVWVAVLSYVLSWVAQPWRAPSP